VRVTREQWDALLSELGHRAAGVRESGAFLLARTDGRPRTVARVVYYDDVDPACLTGGISMHASGFDELWAICTAEKLRVIADVHTHPASYVKQSDIDEANPMIAKAGHIAIIVPYLAADHVTARECGVHIYRGSHKWDAAFGARAARLFYVGRWA
jgi:hypothetical protein